MERAITLVVCTRNRAAQLALALPYFAKLETGERWELVLVDNGSTDATAGVLAAFARGSGLEVSVIGEPRTGLAAARNAGWRRARGAIVAFTDDDCYPVADYLEQVLRCFAGADLGYLGGRVLLYDRNDYPITIKTSEAREDLPPRSFLPAGVIHGANFAVRRDVLEALGGFDERFGAGSGLESAEDIDLVARASAAGWRGAYDPRPVVYHHHRRSKPEDIRRLKAMYDVGRGAFYAKAVLDRRMRRPYLWPVVRRIGGNVARRDFGVLGRELLGAWKFVVSSQPRE
jgi:GT2 family glycosyltransferase